MNIYINCRQPPAEGTSPTHLKSSLTSQGHNIMELSKVFSRSQARFKTSLELDSAGPFHFMRIKCTRDE